MNKRSLGSGGGSRRIKESITLLAEITRTGQLADNFDWRTDEDGEWEGADPDRGRSKSRRRWIVPLTIILILLAGGGAVYWQVQKRVSAAEAGIKDDVRSSFQLIRQANAEGDIELFRNLLSGSDLAWAATQQELFGQGWLFDLSAYGLSAGPLAVSDIQVALAPQLNSAEVSSVATYGARGGDLLPDTVRLLQTKVFRRGQRWVWSPPREEFWGGNASVEERFLAVTYPSRDEALVLRLARDLDRLVAELCRDTVGLTCLEDQTLRLLFSREPEAILAISQRFAEHGLFGARLSRPPLSSGELELTLPTPSLLGVPVDETSYQALLKGYGTQLAIALVNLIADEDCCGSETRVRAAARDMLFDLGLDPWFGLDVENTASGADRPGRDEVALLCSDGFQRQQRLFLLDLTHTTWQEQTLDTELLAVKAMPDGDGVLLLGQIVGERNTRSQVWHYSAQGTTLLLDLPVSADQAEQISWELQEQQRLLVIEVPDLHRGYSRYFTIDLAQCGHGECPEPPQSTVSRPVWSPDGSQMMVHAYGLLWWRAGASMVPIANGSAPFWVDEERYGYVRAFGQEQAVVLVQAGQEESGRVVLTTDSLRDALGLDTRPGRLLIGRVMAGQAGGAGHESGEWLILAFEIGRDGAVNQALMFVYDLDAQEVRLIPHAGRLMSFNLTPSGDKMAIGGFMEDAGRWAITVVGQDMADAVTMMLEPGSSTEALPSYSWSQDESRLLVLDQGLLTFVHPDSGTIYKAAPPEASCVQAAWYGGSGRS